MNPLACSLSLHISETTESGRFISRETFNRNGAKNLMFQSKKRGNASMELIREQLGVFYNQRNNKNRMEK
ncbi:hypothetical protein [Chondrinema litorale]|uniref:hypothetical protein n=1 Tax=Chondrinema litorale TaxID=2994555 RepID=UPI002543756E|nr:hypothetical protein [Chondrinema litorale]UZR99104.1 hypothetical protein OQ292_35125 [Chondrinema litorale]